MPVKTTEETCRTCGFVHAVSPWGGCQRRDEALFDVLTPAELNTLDYKLARALRSAQDEFRALGLRDDALNRDLYDVSQRAYGALIMDAAWLRCEVADERTFRS